MSFQVTTAHKETYRNNVDLVLQQKQPKLAGLAMQQSDTGEKIEFTNFIGKVKSRKKSTRHAAVTYADTPHTRRWLAAPELDFFADLVDKEDRLKSGIDIQGGYTMAAAATIVRAWDDAWLAGFYGTALTGKDGTTLVSFPAGQIVPVTEGAAAATGMNVDKIIAARELMVAGEVDFEMEDAYIAITSKQATDLWKEIRITNRDYASMGGGAVVSPDGKKLVGFLGFKFVEVEYGLSSSFHSSTLSVDGSGYRRVPVWTSSGMGINYWQRQFTSIDNMPGMHHAVQVYASTMVAATRLDEGKCVQILCAE